MQKLQKYVVKWGWHSYEAVKKLYIVRCFAEKVMSDNSAIRQTHRSAARCRFAGSRAKRHTAEARTCRCDTDSTRADKLYSL